MPSLEKKVEHVLATGAELSAYWYFDETEADRVLKQFGWKPINITRPKFRFAREILAIYKRVQVYYNPASKSKFAFLGYHEVELVRMNGVFTIDELWLRIIGDYELKAYS
jgi:hypothetical protein